MKIAMLTNNYKPFVGGVPISVERLAKELRKQGHKVTVFAPDYGFDPRYGQVEEDDVIRFQVTRQKMENGTEVSMAVLPTGLDDSFYIEDEEKTKTIRRQYLGEEKNGHLFCSVSRLEEEKNPIFLLNGIRCLKEKLPFSFRVLLLGEGSMRKELEVLAEQMGLSDTVVFLGNISNEDVKQYLYASELFLFASKSETQGIVLEEAMAAGNPIVAVRASGVEDVVKNGINGYMTEEDVEIWSDKAAELIQSPDYRQVCMEARKTAEGYRASRLAAHAETLYRQCMERKEEMRYEEHTKSGKEHSAASVFRLFKTS